MAMSDSGALTIGEVINLLKGEYPDVSVSKVRFLESQGLIRPSRSPSGYRQFHHDDLQRLRFILKQQRDHFLPLKVIKSRLTMWERGEDAGVDEPPPSAITGLDARQRTIARDELIGQTSLTSRQYRDLVEHGILKPDEDGNLPAESIQIAEEALRLFEHGLEARHLRAVRLGADREADILDQLTAPLRRNRSPEGRRIALDTLQDCADALQRLHAALLRHDLKTILGR